MSSKYVRSSNRQPGLEVAGAILVLFGASVLSAASASALVVHLYKALWAAGILFVVRFRWKARFPLRAPLYRIAATATILVVTLRLMALLQPYTERAIDVASVSRVWLFAAAALAIPAAIGRELFFRGLIYDLAWRKGGVSAAVAASGLLPVAMQLPFSASLRAVVLAAASGLLLAASRAVTGSLAPALFAEALLSLSGVAFILLVV